MSVRVTMQIPLFTEDDAAIVHHLHRNVGGGPAGLSILRREPRDAFVFCNKTRQKHVDEVNLMISPG